MSPSDNVSNLQKMAGIANTHITQIGKLPHVSDSLAQKSAIYLCNRLHFQVVGHESVAPVTISP
jgi:hypothetical protein